MANRYDIDKAPSELSFGNQGESGITAYEFDCSAWLLAYPEGALSVTFMAPNSLTVTVVPPSQAVAADGILTLTVLQNMTAEYGLGSINVRLVDGDDIELHSKVIDVRVKESHYAPSGEIPSVMQDWVSEVAAKWGAVDAVVTESVPGTLPTAEVTQNETGTHFAFDLPTDLVADASATTLDTGEPATAEVTQNETGTHFAFGLPRGLTGPQGIQGIQGADGDTPVRGVDYWTAEDIAAIESYCEDYIDTEILGGTS